METAVDAIRALTGLAWPLIVAALLWRLDPPSSTNALPERGLGFAPTHRATPATVPSGPPSAA
jgi:hypothetical protein